LLEGKKINLDYAYHRDGINGRMNDLLSLQEKKGVRVIISIFKS
jgi:hypothetical protein